MRFERTYEGRRGRPYTLKGDEKGGLVIHRSLRWDGTVDSRRSYTVAHAESGYSVVKWIKTKAEAVEVRERLLVLAVWTQPREALAVPELLRKVQPMRDAAETI